MDQHASEKQEFTLVDAVLPLAESWRLLLLPPLLLAILVFTIIELSPHSVTFSSVVHLAPSQTARLIAESVKADHVPKLHIAQGSRDGESIVYLTVTDRTNGAANLAAILEPLKADANAALLAKRKALQDDIEAARKDTLAFSNLSASLADAFTVLAGQENLEKATLDMFSDGVATVAQELAVNRTFIRERTAILTELVDVDPISPPATSDAGKRSFFLALLVFGGGLFVTLGVVFLREELKYTASHPAGRAKLTRLKRAFIRKKDTKEAAQ